MRGIALDAATGQTMIAPQDGTTGSAAGTRPRRHIVAGLRGEGVCQRRLPRACRHSIAMLVSTTGGICGPEINKIGAVHALAEVVPQHIVQRSTTTATRASGIGRTAGLRRRRTIVVSVWVLVVPYSRRRHQQRLQPPGSRPRRLGVTATAVRSMEIGSTLGIWSKRRGVVSTKAGDAPEGGRPRLAAASRAQRVGLGGQGFGFAPERLARPTKTRQRAAHSSRRRRRDRPALPARRSNARRATSPRSASGSCSATAILATWRPTP